MPNVTFEVNLLNGKRATKVKDGLTYLPRVKDLVTFLTPTGKLTFLVYKVEHIFSNPFEEVWITMDELIPTKNLEATLTKDHWQIEEIHD